MYLKGSIAGQQGNGGKVAAIDVTEPSGRIEDLLNLFVSARTPPMTGSVTFHGHAEIPPDPGGFVQRMKLQGDFGIAGGKFTDKATEGDISRLSESADKQLKGQRQENPETVLSKLQGHGAATNGVATLSNLSFSVPGAQATLAGTYNLLNYQIDLHGVLATTGQLGDATTGFQSFLVKAMGPLFKRRHAEKVVPFKITGNYQDPRIELDLGSKKK